MGGLGVRLVTQTNALTAALDDMSVVTDEEDKKTAAVRVQKIMVDIVTNSAQGVLAGTAPPPSPRSKPPTRHPQP